MKLPPNAPSRVADAEELATFTDEELKKGSKIVSDFYCHRCLGSGSYAGGVCFNCGGRRTEKGRLYTPEKRAALDAAKKVRAEKKRQERINWKQELFLASAKKFPEQHRIAAEIMDLVMGEGREVAIQKWGSFVVDVAEQSIEKGFTDNQASSFLNAYEGRIKYLAKVEEEKENASPVVEGRQVIRGVVVSTKWKETLYGSTLKMLVKEDRGFKVWGSVPKALIHELDNRSPGTRIEFQAEVEASKGDDETFGFFKRPTQAKVVE